ncbi:MAG TPA: hypothetical protein PLC44_04800 [Saprospiraceae bacterium]|nr:hypothetical protein [Saprospiraceae bacterium]HNF10809.1 hypothetical protein [Saprospiraceae bacterium]HNM53390.1 hypothetical protein [Saprospiraceae bacterium]HNO17810.1 hypothetical protein [Saprospiraceae bacterium]
MVPRKLILVFGLVICLTTVSKGQSVEIPQTVRKGVIYKKERSFIAAIQTNGYYFGYSLGKIDKYYLTKYLYFDLGHLKDNRESKINQSYSTNGVLSNYIYAKQNDLWNLRAGRGFLRYFSEKTRRKGVAVGLRCEGGLLLGVLKPYYLQVRDKVDNYYAINEIRYSSDNADVFLDKSRIIGASSFGRGLTELRVVPGGFARIGLSLDSGAFEKMVRSINTGLSLDIYSSRVPILAASKNRFLFVNFFLNVQFGKRH